MSVSTIRPVIVMELPEAHNQAASREFLHALHLELTKSVRPSVVLDCSRVKKIDRDVLHLMLCCLEETMKRNGDLRLAAVPAVMSSTPGFSGVRHLFRAYPSRTEAVDSFRRPSAERISQTSMRSAIEPAADAA